MRTDFGDLAAISFVEPAIACRMAAYLKEHDIPVAWSPRTPRGTMRGTFVYYMKMDGDRIRETCRRCPDSIIVFGSGEPLWSRFKPIEHKWIPEFWEWLTENEFA